jgi:hypothetical protein
VIPETHPLIESITETLADNAERRMDAHGFLVRNFDAAHPGVADMTARLEVASRRKFRVLRKVLPWVLAAVAIAAVVFANASTLRFARAVYNFDIFEPWEKPVLPSGMTEEGRLILGDPAIDDLEQKRRLHLHAPENPAYFAEYGQGFVSKNSTLPPDFLENAARIAPGNAFFPYFAAGLTGKESISKNKVSGPSPPPRYVDGVRLSNLPRESEFTIKDPAVFDQAMEQIAKATALPGFETYTNPMIAARVRLLAVGNMAEFTRALVYAYGASTSGIIYVRHIADLMSARAEQLSKSGRKEEFLALVKQRDAFIVHLGHNPDSILVGELVYAVIASATATNFRFAAERLDLTEIAETYRKQSDVFREDKDLKEIRQKKTTNPFPEAKASSLTLLTLPMLDRQVNSPPPLNDAEFEPLRRAEHELAGGLGLLVAVLIIPLAALVVFLFRFIARPIIRLLAKRMAGVLGMADWGWVIGIGVVVPISLFLIVTRLTPLGGREYGVLFFQALFPGVPLVALLLGLLIAPAIVVRWRLTKRLAPFGLSDRFTVPISLVMLTIILVWSLAALPILVRFGAENQYILIALAAPPALCLGLVIANALRSIFGKPTARLAQAATAMAVLPAYPIGIIALCTLTPIYSAGEKRWLAKETLLRINPDAPDLGAYEFKVTAQKRKEINAITGVE